MWFSAVMSTSKDTDALLLEKLQQLSDLADRQTVIHMDIRKFNSYVKTTPRNYSVIVMLTTLHSHRQCHFCRQAKDEYDIVANSWRYGTTFVDFQMYFAFVDFDEAPDVFSYLNINTVPQVVHFPVKGKPKHTDTMDIYRVGFSAEAIAKFVTDKTAVQIRVHRPPDYSNILILGGLFVTITSLVYLKRRNLEFFYNKSAWATFTLAVLFMMTSGQMWNHIRAPPFMENDPRSGSAIYVHPWSDSQFIAETYIVFALNVAVVSGFILLSEARSMKSHVRKKRVVAICALGSIVFFFSVLLSVFRSKHEGYPYSFLLK